MLGPRQRGQFHVEFRQRTRVFRQLGQGCCSFPNLILDEYFHFGGTVFTGAQIVENTGVALISTGLLWAGRPPSSANERRNGSRLCVKIVARSKNERKQRFHHSHPRFEDRGGLKPLACVRRRAGRGGGVG